jgi:hypothetical protein
MCHKRAARDLAAVALIAPFFGLKVRCGEAFWGFDS